MKRATRTTEYLATDGIVVRDRLRALKPGVVDALAEGMKAIGMRTPISVRMTSEEDGYEAILVTGNHRLEAARRLGWEKIECFVVETENEIDAQKWEIAENLQRGNLTKLERRKHIKKWMELSGYSDPSSANSPRKQRVSGKHTDKGITAAAKELGVDPKEVRRSESVGEISEEVQAALTDAGLDNNDSALEVVSRKPAEEQVATVHAIQAAGTVQAFKLAADPTSDEQALEKQVAKLMAAWNSACPDARQEFMCRIEQPIMDRRYA